MIVRPIAALLLVPAGIVAAPAQAARPVNQLQAVTRVAANLVSGHGVVVPAQPGSSLDVQVLRDGRWSTVSRIVQGQGGRYRFSVLPTVPGAQRFRTVSLTEAGPRGSAALPVFVTGPVTPFTVALGDLDGDTTAPRTPPPSGPPRPAAAVWLSRPGNSPGRASYALTPGLRTFRGTLSLVTDPGGEDEDMLVSIRTNLRTYLVRWFDAGTVLPLTLDVSGARYLEFSEFDHGWTSEATSHLVLRSASLSTVPAAEQGLDPDVRYLTDLPRTPLTTCPRTGLTMSGNAAPASLTWSDCPAGSAAGYDLDGAYSRLRATVSVPSIGGDSYPLEFGVLTVTADGHEVARVDSGTSRELDLDLTGVQHLSFAVSPEPDETRAYVTVLTPVLTRA